MNARAILQFLSGKKTYIVGAIGVLYSLGVSRGWWPNDATIWGALGSVGAMTLRAAIAKMLTQFLDDLTKASATPACAEATAGKPAAGTAATTKNP